MNKHIRMCMPYNIQHFQIIRSHECLVGRFLCWAIGGGRKISAAMCGTAAASADARFSASSHMHIIQQQQQQTFE